jgi:hypothetical protein
MKYLLTILTTVLTLKLYSQDRIRVVLTESYQNDTVEVKIGNKTEFRKVFFTDNSGFAGEFYVKKTNINKSSKIKIKVNGLEKDFLLDNNKNYYLTYCKKRRMINLRPTNKIILK